MLRTLQCRHIAPRLQGFKFTTTVAPAATLNIGSEEATIARNAAGKATITLGRPAYREGVVVATPGVDIAAGGYGVFDTAHAESSIKAEMLNEAAGAGDDGTGYALALSFDADNTDRSYPSQAVKNPALMPRLMGFRMTAAGAVALGRYQGVDSLAANVHTVTLRNPFQRAPIVVASPINAAARAVRVTAATASSFAIEGKTVGGALSDEDVYALVLGWDNPHISGVSERAVKVPQVAPRMEVFRIDGIGVAAIDLGSTDATLVDNGAGDYSLTWAEPFKREPVVIVCAKDIRAQLAAAATTTGCRILTFSNAGVAVDDEVYVIVLGFDSSDEV